MKRTLSLVGALALSLAAIGAQAQPMGPAPMGPGQMAPRPMHPGMMTPGGALPTPEYIHAAAQSDEFEIAEAKLALAHSQNPHVKMFANKMIHDHTESTMMIKAAIRHDGHMVPPPPPLSPMQHQMIDQLRAAGPDFDKTYIDQQIQAHDMALSTHQGYAQSGGNMALRTTAGKIVPVVQMHLQMLHDMQSHMASLRDPSARG